MRIEINHFDGKHICCASMDTPGVGETVTIDRVDYKVIERKWSICNATSCYGCEIIVKDTNHPEESFMPEPKERRDVHTEHCCRIHGCKYGDGEACPVESGSKRQSGPCESCGDNY